MILVVSGTRQDLAAEDIYRIQQAIKQWGESLQIEGLYHGGCPTGVDALANRVRGVPIKVFPADWQKHGKAAGPMRNREMLRAAAEHKGSVLLAFPKGRSPGTRGAIQLAMQMGITVEVIEL